MDEYTTTVIWATWILACINLGLTISLWHWSLGK